MSIIDDFSGCVYFHLTSATRSIDQLAEEAFAGSGLSVSQVFLLLYLIQNDGAQAQICAAFLHLAPSTITRMADKLENLGLIIRQFEGRIVYMRPTEKGRKMAPGLQENWNLLYEKMVSRLGQENYDNLLRSLLILE